MKLLLIIFLFSYHISFGQGDTTIYIREFGWTIKMPPGFTVSDSATLAAGDEHARKMIEQSGRKADLSAITHLITATKGRLNSFVVNVSKPGIYTAENWQFKDSIGKEEIIKVFKSATTIKPVIRYSVATIQGREFRKMEADYISTDNSSLHFIHLGTFYNRHLFEIIYFYTDPVAGEQIVYMINTSQFDK